MNRLWGGMLLAGLIFGTLTGRISGISESLLDSSREAVNLCIAMAGVMALWSGMMEIAGDAGLLAAVCRKLRPLLRFLFPHIPENHPALEHITLNCVANMMGIGAAATPAGLAAMRELSRLEEERREEARVKKELDKENLQTDRPGAKSSETLKKTAGAVPRGTASSEMCSFLILNISSLQLIPVSVIAYRSQYGSVNPAAVVAPAILATLASTAAAVLFCRIADRWVRG